MISAGGFMQECLMHVVGFDIFHSLLRFVMDGLSVVFTFTYNNLISDIRTKKSIKNEHKGSRLFNT